MSKTGIAYDRRVKNHNTGPGHPERPERFTAVLNRLEMAGVLAELIQLDTRTATTDELALAHSRQYLDLVGREVAQDREQLSTGDTAIGRASDEVGKIAAGCALTAVDAVFTGQVDNAFCATRPPGHHANSARGMGFCIYNHVAVAARYAQQKYGAERVLIADWDVHHGNGTQDIFYDDSSVLFFSTHQSPWYPGTGAASERGEGRGIGMTINCPLRAGAGRKEIVGAFRERLLPAAHEFCPDVVFLSAGFDSRAGDPLGQFLLTDDDFGELTRMMIDVAAQCCSSRLISVLEGGYSLDGLACASEAHVRALLGLSQPTLV